jgi:anti-sigma factor RsiW
MNREPRSPQDDSMEREWALQEQAVRAERLGLDTSDDQILRRYRAVAHALRKPLDEELPLDFASAVAREARRRAAGDMRLELYLSWALLGVLVAMLIGVMVRYGSALAQFAHIAFSQPWLLALAGFFVLLGVGKLPQRRLG